MRKAQKGKKVYYIACMIAILVICFIIGVSYSNYFPNEVKQHIASNNVKEVETAPKKSAASDLSQPNPSIINLNGMYRLALLSACRFFHENITMHNFDDNNLKYQLAWLLYGTIVPYMGVFVYVNYSLDWNFAKDMASLLFVMPLCCGIITHCIGIFMRGHPVIWCLVSNVICYYLGTYLLELLLSNNKLALLKQGWSFDMQWFYSACMLAYLYYQIHITIKCKKYDSLIARWGLWCIPVAFLYAQAYWSPQRSGTGILHDIVARYSDTKTLWIVLVIMGLYDVIVSDQ